MNQESKSTGDENRARLGTVLAAARPMPAFRRSDLIVDLSGIRALDFTSLALLLTAQQKAQLEDRAVWLVGVPLELWKSLQVMGLGRVFRLFPLSGSLTA